jgi:hypothetical protein
MKSGDPKASGTKSGDKPSSTQAPAKDQSTTGQGAAGASGASLTTEQRTKIKTSIKQVNVRPVTNVNFRGYRFVLVEDEIIIIEPSTYRIVAVIEA